MRNNILCLLGGLAVGILCGYLLPRTSSAEKPELAAKLKEIDAKLADLKRAEGEMKADVAKIRAVHAAAVKPAGNLNAANPSGASANARIDAPAGPVGGGAALDMIRPPVMVQIIEPHPWPTAAFCAASFIGTTAHFDGAMVFLAVQSQAVRVRPSSAGGIQSDPARMR